MTHKQRVTRAIAGEPVDFIPLGLYAVDQEIVSKVIGRPAMVRNRLALRQAYWEGRRDEAVDAYKHDLVDFYRKIDCAGIVTERDAQLVPPKGYAPDPPKKIAENTWEDQEGRVFRAMPEIDQFFCVHDPTVERDSLEFSPDDFIERSEPEPPDPSIFEVIDFFLDELGDDRYFAGPTGGFDPMRYLSRSQDLNMRFAKGLELYALEPELVTTANEHAAAHQDLRDRFFLDVRWDGVGIGKDFGGTNAPLISPAAFEKCCFPSMHRRVVHIKQALTELHPDDPSFTPQVIIHSCGNTIPLLRFFLEAGIDCYQSLQTTAGMDISLLKKKVPKGLAFWGGVSVESLVGGTPDDIRKEVRASLRNGGPTGLIIGPSQSIPMGTKYENFMTMLDTYVNERQMYM